MADMIVKRDGSLVPFDEEKIINAVKAANKDVAQIRQLSEIQIEGIAEQIKWLNTASDHPLTIEEIQNAVEVEIMEMRGYEVAQQYIRYRYQHNLDRAGKQSESKGPSVKVSYRKDVPVISIRDNQGRIVELYLYDADPENPEDDHIGITFVHPTGAADDNHIYPDKLYDILWQTIMVEMDPG